MAKIRTALCTGVLGSDLSGWILLVRRAGGNVKDLIRIYETGTLVKRKKTLPKQTSIAERGAS